MTAVPFDGETGLVTVVADDRVRVVDGADLYRAGMIALAGAALGLPASPELVWSVTGRTALSDGDRSGRWCG